MVAASPSSARNRQSLALAVILLLLLVGGGWGFWRYASSANVVPKGPLADVSADGPTLPRMGRPNWGQLAARVARGVPDGIQFNGNTYMIKAGTTRLDIDRGNGPNWRLRFRYAMPNLVPPDQNDAINVMQRVLQDQAKAKLSGVTPAQIDQLLAIPNGAMMVEPAERDQIKALFLAWLTASGGPPAPARRPVPTSGPASRPAAMAPPVNNANSPAARAAEQKVVAALDSIGKHELAPTQQNNAKRAERVQSTLGAELYGKLKQGG